LSVHPTGSALFPIHIFPSITRFHKKHVEKVSLYRYNDSKGQKVMPFMLAWETMTLETEKHEEESKETL
jgi:hypothetical protein